MRDLSNPERFGHPAHAEDWVSTCADENGVHTNSGIFNKAYYNVATALDKFRAERIFYRALVIYLQPKSSLEDGRAAAIQAAIDLYGDGIEKQEVVNGFNAVGLDGKWNPKPNDCGGCAVTNVTADRGLFANAIDNLRTVTTLYRVRDVLLNSTSAGLHYRTLYEEHTGSISRLLATNGDLRRRGAALLGVTQADLDRLVDGQGDDTVVTPDLVEDMQAFLTDLAISAENGGEDELAHTIRREMNRLNWSRLVGMSFEEAWQYLNEPPTYFVPVISR
jgi:hypothetical protein